MENATQVVVNNAIQSLVASHVSAALTPKPFTKIKFDVEGETGKEFAFIFTGDSRVAETENSIIYSGVSLFLTPNGFAHHKAELKVRVALRRTKVEEVALSVATGQ